MAKAEEQTTEITLSDGRKAVIRAGVGSDLVAAMRVCRDQNEIPMALAANLTTIDGEPIVLEDLMQMPLTDVMALQAEVMGGEGNSLTPAL